jgi:hypothetical protein
MKDRILKPVILLKFKRRLQVIVSIRQEPSDEHLLGLPVFPKHKAKHPVYTSQRVASTLLGTVQRIVMAFAGFTQDMMENAAHYSSITSDSEQLGTLTTPTIRLLAVVHSAVTYYRDIAILSKS